MKRTLLIITALMAAALSYAQRVEGTIKVRARQDLVRALPKDIAYLLPEFSDGVVDFTDGTSSPGRINICNLDNSVRFINTAGDTLLLSGADRVSRVIVNGTVYAKVADQGFLRQKAVYGKLSLCERRRLTVEPVKEDAGYSGIPATSTAKGARMVQIDHDYMETGEREISYMLRTDVVLTDGSEIYVSKSSTFNKLFPQAKKAAKAFVKSNKTDFQDLDSAAQLFLFCAEQK